MKIECCVHLEKVMRNIFIAVPVFLFLASCSIRKERVHPCIHSEISRREKRGVYSRNVAQGWTRPNATTEVIPDIPQYQIIQLKRFRKFTFQPSHHHPENKWSGKWKKHQDTLEITFSIKRNDSTSRKRIKLTDRFLISEMHLTPLETEMISAKTIGHNSFSRSNDHHNEQFPRRIKKFTECYPNGFLSSSKRMIHINRFRRNETYVVYHGRQKYYDSRGKLISIVRYRKGEIKCEKKFTPAD